MPNPTKLVVTFDANGDPIEQYLEMSDEEAAQAEADTAAWEATVAAEAEVEAEETATAARAEVLADKLDAGTASPAEINEALALALRSSTAP